VRATESCGADAPDQEAIEEDVGAEVLERLLRRGLDLIGADHRFILRRDDELEVVAVGDHVQGDAPEDRNLHDDPQVPGLAHQDVALEGGVGGDLAGVAAADAGGERDRGVEGVEGVEVGVELLHQLGGRGVHDDVGGTNLLDEAGVLVAAGQDHGHSQQEQLWERRERFFQPGVHDLQVYLSLRALTQRPGMAAK
jgi:hypothetical protein